MGDTDTTSRDNKAVMQRIFDALAEGQARPLVDAMADDFRWTISGHSAWAGSFDGKQAVREQLLRPLAARFATPYTNRATRIVADGDIVVVECRGDTTTKDGKRYDNRYCWVCRLAGGKLVELTEYMDTQFAASVLGLP